MKTNGMLHSLGTTRDHSQVSDARLHGPGSREQRPDVAPQSVRLSVGRGRPPEQPQPATLVTVGALQSAGESAQQEPR